MKNKFNEGYEKDRQEISEKNMEESKENRRVCRECGVQDDNEKRTKNFCYNCNQLLITISKEEYEKKRGVVLQSKTEILLKRIGRIIVNGTPLKDYDEFKKIKEEEGF